MKFTFFSRKNRNIKEHGKMLSHYIRIVTGLIVVLVAAGVTLALANTQTVTSAQVPTPTSLPTKATADNCDSCHADVHELWHKGAHGDARAEIALDEKDNCAACHKDIPESSQPDPATTPPTFTNFWTEQGMPITCLQCHVTGYDPSTGTWKADGITCESCHNPIPSNHPDENMPVDKNTELCRTCHTDERFGWDTWNESAHSQNDITCSNCHNPHSTSLKPTDLNATDSSSLCVNCHKETEENITHSQHIESGATCVKCHLGDSKGDDEFHQVPDHDFKPKLDACYSCHADQMHGDGKPVSLAVVADPPVKVDASAKASSVVTKAPAAVSPLGYAGLAVALGLLGGVVWNNIIKRFSKRKVEKK